MQDLKESDYEEDNTTGLIHSSTLTPKIAARAFIHFFPANMSPLDPSPIKRSACPMESCSAVDCREPMKNNIAKNLHSTWISNLNLMVSKKKSYLAMTVGLMIELLIRLKNF